ncbi:MAG: NAD(P)H-binding protein, partial [Acidobacteriota bacterium]
LLVGATGLVGGHLLRLLVASPRYRTVYAPARRELPIQDPKLRPRRVDFNRLDDAEDEIFAVEDVFCALGTTIKKAGSQEAFRRVDQHYVVEVARRARDAGARRFTLVSSIGADAESTNFYLEVKGAAEDDVAACGYPELHILRPSLLVGDRKELRPGERAAVLGSKLFAPLLCGPVAQYRPVHARTVAAAMLGAASVTPGDGRAQGDGRFVYTYARIAALAGAGAGSST